MYVSGSQLMEALKLIGRFSQKSTGYIEVWDENEIVIRNVKTNDAIEFIDLSEETPKSLVNKLNKLIYDES